MPDRDLIKTSQRFRVVAGNKEKVLRIYGGQYTNSGSCVTTRGAGGGISLAAQPRCSAGVRESTLSSAIAG